VFKLNIWLKVLWESLVMAWFTIFANKLRTFLSVLGITIGIFSIVAVFTLISSFENQLKESLSTLGKTVVYVDVFPWESEGGEYPWWKYMNRPSPKQGEATALSHSELTDLAEVICFKADISGTITVPHSAEIAEGVSVIAVSDGYSNVQDVNIFTGRYFSYQDIAVGASVIVIGYNLAENLFGSPEKAIQQFLTFKGNRLVIIGVLAKEGESVFQSSMDERAIIPLRLLEFMVGSELKNYSPQIIVKAKDGISIDALAMELKGAMRKVRRLSPRAEDNFALNKVTFLLDYLSMFFKQVHVFGLIIGGFSLLVGGFGVANIMFVSVKERTHIIGIQKAIGAKSFFILSQFLTESIILCLLGGFIGILGVWVVSILANIALGSADYDFKLVLSYSNIITGFWYSFIIGVFAGIIPAYSASKLQPVDAIRAN
jgi:putative ABC transport system permease protein